jgi:hypothetical protein
MANDAAAAARPRRRSARATSGRGRFHRRGEDILTGARSIRRAAALLEIQRYDEVVEALTPLATGPCKKARLLLAVARWARGEHDTARALATKAGVEFADLPRATDATACRDGAAPIFVGTTTTTLGRVILKERSEITGAAAQPGRMSLAEAE